MHQMQKINVKILRPFGIEYVSDVDMITMPGIDGEFGVLHGHADMVAELGDGAINFYIQNIVVKTIIITGGVVDIRNSVVSIMCP